METQMLKAEVRNETGKGAARKLRGRGLIPGVFYGPDKEPLPVAVSPKQLLKALEGEYGRNTVLKLELSGGREELVLVKDMQTSPVSYAPLHVDFYGVSEDRTVDAEVPFKTEGRAQGVQKGGVLHATFRTVPVRVVPTKVPPAIVVDVSKLDINDVIRVQDLVPPEGVTVLMPPHRTLVTVMVEKRQLEEETEAAAEGEAPAAADASKSS